MQGRRRGDKTGEGGARVRAGGQEGASGLGGKVRQVAHLVEQ